MTPLTHTAWNGDQWITFGSFVVAGLAGMALLILAVEHLHRRRREAIRVRAAAFAGSWPPAARIDGTIRALVAGPFARELPWRTPDGRIDPASPYIGPDIRFPSPVGIGPTSEVLAHVAPGPGSLTTLAQVGEGNLITITHDDLVDPEVAQWFIDAFDRPAHMPARNEARELDEGGVLTRWHTAVEAPMRQARLWSLRNHAGHGGTASCWADLDRWRIDTPTGEYPSPFLVEPEYAAADLAEALLIS